MYAIKHEISYDGRNVNDNIQSSKRPPRTINPKIRAQKIQA